MSGTRSFVPLKIEQSITSKSSEMGLHQSESNTLFSSETKAVNFGSISSSTPEQIAYNKVRKICDTPQGNIIEAVASDPQLNQTHVAIKSCNKDLYEQNISYADDDNMQFCCYDDIVKEKQILRHLTIENKPINDYIQKYVGFFQNDKYFYLISELVTNQMSLKTFSEQAHKYIESGQLQSKEYNKILKYIFWQLSVAIYWLHFDMHCVHLNLNMDNIKINNVGNSPFIKHSNGSISINPNIIPKISDFSNAEIFKDSDTFQCTKFKIFGANGGVQFLAPKVYEEQVFDARKADVWALGMCLIECAINQPLYNFIINSHKPRPGTGRWAVAKNKIKMYLAHHNLLSNLNFNMLSLINSLLFYDEKQRMKTSEILQHQWFECYYSKYKQQICKKSTIQKKKLNRQLRQTKLCDFPYYIYNGYDY